MSSWKDETCSRVGHDVEEIWSIPRSFVPGESASGEKLRWHQGEVRRRLGNDLSIEDHMNLCFFHFRSGLSHRSCFRNTFVILFAGRQRNYLINISTGQFDKLSVTSVARRH
ncbi:hypothetical protein M758_12G001700 [Ceratodon purpureus]|nr:hypothetical protein M758_12G001700 [Ceratodon purpureus]